MTGCVNYLIIVLKIRKQKNLFPYFWSWWPDSPLSADKGNSTENPENLEVWVFKGNNTFTMVEDNGRTDYAQHTARTVFENSYDEKTDTVTLKIKAEGDLSVIPENRQYTVVFKDIDTPPVIRKFSKRAVSITINNPKPAEKESYRDRIINVFSRWNETTAKKDSAYKNFEGLEDINSLWRALYKAQLPEPVTDRIKEILSQ